MILVLGHRGFLGKNILKLCSNTCTIESLPKKSTDVKFIIDCTDTFSPSDDCIQISDSIDRINFNLNIWKLYTTAKYISFNSAWAYDGSLVNLNSHNFYSMNNSVNIYGHCKRHQIFMVESFAKFYNLSYAIFLLGNIFGPHDRSNRIIPSLLKSYIKYNSCIINTTGVERRTFMYVDDVCNFILNNMNFINGHYVISNKYMNKSIMDIIAIINPKNVTCTNTIGQSRILEHHTDISCEELEISLDKTLQYYKNLESV